MRYQETYKGFDIHQNTESNEVAILLDTPDGSFRQHSERNIQSVEEAKEFIDSDSFRKQL